MQKLTTSALLIVFSIMHWTSIAGAQGDLDVEGARRRYDAQKEVSDRYKASYDREVSRLNALRSTADQARQQQREAQSQLQSTQSNLSAVETSISSKEREISDLQADLITLNTKLNQYNSQLTTAQNNQSRSEARIRDLNRRIDQIQHQIDQLNSDPTGNASQIAALQHEKQGVESDRSSEQSRLNDANRQVDSAERNINNTQNSIASKEGDITRYRSDIASLDRQRSRLLSDINFYRSEVNRAGDRVADADRDVSLQTPVVAQANSEYQRELQKTNDTQRYLDQVIANYNRELNLVYAAADRAAAEHAGRDATELATPKGSADGEAQGRIAGTTAGERDGRELQKTKGYRGGRNNPQGDAELTAIFTKGLEDGESAATLKARGEDFPRGYNDALARALNFVPEQESELDLREGDPVTSGVPSPELSQQNKVVTSTPSPDFPIPVDPSGTPPSMQDPTVQIPDHDSTATPPCTNLVLPEFEAKCRLRYRDSFASSFRASYRQFYLVQYKQKFEPAAAQVYSEVRAANYPDAFRTGTVDGAKHQGILVGFQRRLLLAREEQYQLGYADLDATVLRSHLVIPRGLEIRDRNNDGIFSPGEAIDVNLVVDNLGGTASPDQKLKLIVKGKIGLASINFETRILPAIAAKSRLKLLGIATVGVQSLSPGDRFQISGEVLALGANGTYRTEQSFVLSDALHYPLELSSVDLEKNPRVGEKVVTKFKFTNRTNTVVPEGKVSISVSPRLAEVGNAANVDLPSLESGATHEITADVTPGIWVSENMATPFLSQITRGESVVQQPFGKLIHIVRTASALIFDQQGADLLAGQVTINAGSILTIYAQMKYHATTARSGPFVLRALSTSNSEITHANGSTSSINYGSWSPSSVPSKIRIMYTIPQSMKGQKGWVMLELYEGNSNAPLHRPVVYLDVK